MVFVNEQRVELPAGAVVKDAVVACDPALLQAVAAGRGYVTDGVGHPVDLGDRIEAGSILRVVLTARSRSRSGSEAEQSR